VPILFHSRDEAADIDRCCFSECLGRQTMGHLPTDAQDSNQDCASEDTTLIGHAEQFTTSTGINHNWES